MGPKPRQTGKGRPRGKLEREAVDSEDEDLLGASFKSLGPRARKTIKEFSSYSGEMPPPEAEETWSDIDFHNFFFSGGFIKPKKKAKPKPSPVLMREHYKTLGIQEGCKGDEVRRIYRKLALKYHPDKNLGTDENTSKFQDITEAYEAVCAQLHEMEQETEKWP